MKTNEELKDSLHAELNELKERTKRLMDFIYSEEFQKVKDTVHRRLLKNQLYTMHNYASILNDRISTLLNPEE